MGGLAVLYASDQPGLVRPGRLTAGIPADAMVSNRGLKPPYDLRSTQLLKAFATAPFKHLPFGGDRAVRGAFHPASGFACKAQKTWS
jgi:hypothetical protein